MIAASVLALHLITNGQYDFHRDSLYYLDSARHSDWGYVDYPPVTPMIARLSLELFGNSVWGLRLWPSLAGALIVVLAALIARELGGGRAAQVLAAIGAATSPVLLGANWLFQTVTFDQLVWMSSFWVVARLLRTGDRRLWLALGGLIGVGLETKYTIVALILGLAAGTVLTPARRQLLTPWPWLGAAIAFAIFLPNLIWQAGHGWPSVEYTLNHKSAQSLDFSPLTFLAQQVALIGPLAIPLWIAGLYWLMANPARRMLGIAAAVPFLIYMFAGKSYYIGPLHPFLVGAGMCWLEKLTLDVRTWLRPASAIALFAQAIVLLPLVLPVLPESAVARTQLPVIRKDFGDTIGWHDFVDQVGQIYDSLSPEDRRTAVILTDNYGEAGAINTYGRSRGLPTAVSGQLTYYYWRPSSLDGPVIAVGVDVDFLATLFDTCELAGTISNSYGLHNEEFGAPLSVCRGPRYALDDLWPKLKTFR